MAVTIYRSSDASAPVLSGQVGALITLLDGVLRTGYGTQPGAGWTKPFTGTNGAVFKQGAGSCGFYLTVNDNGPGAGLAKEARAWGGELVSAYSATNGSVTNPFPTAAQMASGGFIRKSATADATARPWIMAADSRTFYLFIATGDSAGFYLTHAFGDFSSYLAGDPYNCMFVMRSTENSSSLTVDTIDEITTIGSSGHSGHYWARTYTGTGGSVNFSKGGARATSVTSPATLGPGANSLTYPNPPDGAVYAARFLLGDAGGAGVNLRGEFRGLWMLAHPISTVIDGDTFVATSGTLSGKSFVCIKQSGNGGVFLLETSNTWAA